MATNERDRMYERRQEGVWTSPATFTDQAFSQAIYMATGLQRRIGRARVVEVMAGQSRVIRSLFELNPNHDYLRIDSSRLLLQRLEAKDHELDTEQRQIPSNIQSIQGEPRNLPLKPESVDIIVVRYGFKDFLPQPQQTAIEEASRALVHGGILVVADMVGLTEETAQWVTEQHGKKQNYSANDPDRDIRCHIPSVQEWQESLSTAGLRVTTMAFHTSQVDTQDWVDNGQITPEQRLLLNEFILNAPTAAQDEFNIRKEGDKVKIDYLVRVFRAVKV